MNEPLPSRILVRRNSLVVREQISMTFYVHLFTHLYKIQKTVIKYTRWTEPKLLRRLERTLQSWVPPMLVKKYVQVCRSERLSRHAGHQEISRCCSRGESEESIAVCDKARKPGIHHSFEMRNRRHQKSKTGVSDQWCPSMIKKIIYKIKIKRKK